jgi:NADPH:quinone reductase-like Zn-dependent oxidoreductase
MVRSIGADEVLDYTHEDVTAGGARFDVILDNAGTHPYSVLRRMLHPKGVLIPNNGTTGGRWIGTVGRLLKGKMTFPFVSQRLRSFVSKQKNADLVVLQGLIESGDVTPVVGRTFPLVEADEALRYVGAGHARGKVVVTV